MIVGKIRRFALVEQGWPRILGLRSQEDDPLAPLRKAECLRVDDSISPGIATPLKLIDKPAHCLATIERKHEGNVLEKEPCRGRIRTVQQTKYMLYQAGLRAGDSSGSSGLAQVLAWKAGREEIARRKLIESRDVWMYRHLGKLLTQDRPSRVIDLGEEHGMVASLTKAELDSSDARKESDYAQGWISCHEAKSIKPVGGRERMFVSSESLGLPELPAAADAKRRGTTGLTPWRKHEVIDPPGQPRSGEPFVGPKK
jgi:hypothetical protein